MNGNFANNQNEKNSFLNRFAINLNEAAKNGKLDPVIGRDEEIRNVIAGKTDKMLIVVGPCSAHEPAPTLEYISRLGKLNEKVKDMEVIQ